MVKVDGAFFASAAFPVTVQMTMVKSDLSTLLLSSQGSSINHLG